MNNNAGKRSSKEENRKFREDADKVADEEKAKNQGKKGKRGNKEGAVLGENNDD